MTKIRRTAAAVLAGLLPLAAAAGWGGPAAAQADPALSALNDYPTVARADYVFGCMAANDQTREALERCSCSIDVIASIISYDEYVQAETVMRMRHLGGEKTVLFRTAAPSKDAFAKLKRAQAEAEMRCF